MRTERENTGTRNTDMLTREYRESRQTQGRARGHAGDETETDWRPKGTNKQEPRTKNKLIISLVFLSYTSLNPRK